ncbi:peptidyl-tRNA hydrolase [Wolfiporia cocos MD-104 SS10]|uniref:peptidyl-tRNA hydrolase n=1 Tax=Wolfiporia cocos (strain MD-104) TaxID=742152 RepID=A0A2H3J8M2_WOLCO|nr:peptidyl-tRNA hydrolase [Wolfiporia cocos MD-104 SS10]
MPRIPHFLIVGLGNVPYPLTRHSVGHLVVDSLASRLNILFEFEKIARGREATKVVMIGSTKVKLHFFKPNALMNVSGRPVRTYMDHVEAPPSNVIVIHDSLDHKPMTFHPKLGGSANGHNGVKSVISTLQGEEFHRFRIGIGRDESMDPADFVLSKLPREEVNFWKTHGEGIDLVWDQLCKIVVETSAR